METKDIIEFRNLIKDFSLEQLLEEQKKIEQEVSKMILNSDLIVKAALIESLINEKEGRNNG